MEGLNVEVFEGSIKSLKAQPLRGLNRGLWENFVSTKWSYGTFGPNRKVFFLNFDQSGVHNSILHVFEFSSRNFPFFALSTISCPHAACVMVFLIITEHRRQEWREAIIWLFVLRQADVGEIVESCSPGASPWRQ